MRDRKGLCHLFLADVTSSSLMTRGADGSALVRSLKIPLSLSEIEGRGGVASWKEKPRGRILSGSGWGGLERKDHCPGGRPPPAGRGPGPAPQSCRLTPGALSPSIPTTSQGQRQPRCGEEILRPTPPRVPRDLGSFRALRGRVSP